LLQTLYVTVFNHFAVISPKLPNSAE